MITGYQEGYMACDYFKALNLAKAGKWDKAHEMVQPYSDPCSCRIHGFLHRVEGDLDNARYWYSRAGMDMPGNSLENELHCLYEMVESTPTTPSN
jgi:hypothetical protein